MFGMFPASLEDIATVLLLAIRSRGILTEKSLKEDYQLVSIKSTSFVWRSLLGLAYKLLVIIAGLSLATLLFSFLLWLNCANEEIMMTRQQLKNGTSCCPSFTLPCQCPGQNGTRSSFCLPCPCQCPGQNGIWIPKECILPLVRAMAVYAYNRLVDIIWNFNRY